MHTRTNGDNHQMEYNHPLSTQVFAQELDNTNQIEYHKETRLLTTKLSKEPSSSAIKATKLNLKGSNSTTYSDLWEHKMVIPQKALLSQTEPGQGEKTSRVTTSNSPDDRNIYKFTSDTNNDEIVNITTSNDDESEDDNESILPPTSYSAGMHTSGDDTDGQDGPNLLDTDKDDNEEIQNNQDRKDMGDSAVELMERVRG